MYPHQVDRLTLAIEGEGLAALIATSAENVFYMTGFRSLHHALAGGPQFALWTPGGTALVVPAVDVPLLTSEGVDADHVVAFGDVVCSYADGLGPKERKIRERTESRASSPEDALAAALQALGVSGGRIGLDESRLTPAAWERLSARAPGHTVVPAAAALSTARRVKSPYEIECLGRALGIAEEALNAVVQMLEPGVTEREAAAVYAREVLGRAAGPSVTSVTFGERTWIPLSPPSERALRKGELIRLDVGAVLKGYAASVGRTAVMGEPSPRQLAAAEAVQAGLEAGIAVVKPGATAGRVHGAVLAATRAGGLPGFERGQVGHAIGLEPCESPMLAAGDATALEAGEVLRVDVPHLEVGWGGVAFADTVLVTTTGTRVLNRSARGLVVLD